MKASATFDRVSGLWVQTLHSFIQAWIIISLASTATADGPLMSPLPLYVSSTFFGALLSSGWFARKISAPALAAAILHIICFTEGIAFVCLLVLGVPTGVAFISSIALLLGIANGLIAPATTSVLRGMNDRRFVAATSFRQALAVSGQIAACLSSIIRPALLVLAAPAACFGLLSLLTLLAAPGARVTASVPAGVSDKANERPVTSMMELGIGSLLVAGLMLTCAQTLSTTYFIPAFTRALGVPSEIAVAGYAGFYICGFAGRILLGFVAHEIRQLRNLLALSALATLLCWGLFLLNRSNPNVATVAGVLSGFGGLGWLSIFYAQIGLRASLRGRSAGGAVALVQMLVFGTSAVTPVLGAQLLSDGSHGLDLIGIILLLNSMAILLIGIQARSDHRFRIGITH